MQISDIQKLDVNNDKLVRCMLEYSSALSFLETTLKILGEDLKVTCDYSPIEHIDMRLKSLDSILKKLEHKELEQSMTSIQENLYDVVGARIVCSFKNDVYNLVDIIRNYDNIEIIEEKDYIENPKRNGYSSYHLKVLLLVPFTNGIKKIKAEIQIKTLAMDFWASVNHKLNYKVDPYLDDEYIAFKLKEMADDVKALDDKIEELVNRLEIKKNNQKRLVKNK